MQDRRSRRRPFARAGWAGLVLLGILAPGPACAELISVLRFGAEVPVPAGFSAQTTDDGWVLRNPRVEGVIFVLPIEDVDLDQLEHEAWQGLTQDGMDLVIDGRPERTGRVGLRARFTGEIDGAKYRALSITRLRPDARYGLTALALAPADRFGEGLEAGVEALARGVSFGPEKPPEAVRSWRAKLERTLLEQVPDVQPGSREAGFTARYELCEDGRFDYAVAPDTGDARSVGRGFWSVEEEGSEPVLVLEFDAGSGDGREGEPGAPAPVASGPANDSVEADSPERPGASGRRAWRFILSEDEGIYALDGERYRPSFARCGD